MGKSYRIKANPGKDNNIVVDLEQDFEQLEILSLKIRQDDVYIRMCSDYGVIAGRVFSNNGYGVPNVKVSVFIPVTQDDLDNPSISAIYPYQTFEDVNDDGYKYNLLPYTPSYDGHVPTGTFPSRKDVLTNDTASKIYEKYYKYTVKTNESGDYLIYGVPIGDQTLIFNVDLSDIGQFSMTPQDLIRIGVATESQFDGANFKSSPNIDTLPQIIKSAKSVDVIPFWGENDICQIGITRMDFDITGEANINIQPTAIFMGSIFSNPDNYSVDVKCKVKKDSGNLCKLITGPGEIIGITQSIFLDDKGLPVLKIADLPNGGKLIDENGVWMFDVPMNNNYVTTNEFGEQVISNDPNIGVPTTGKYRFKIKWQQPDTLTDNYKRGYFLVPNIRENGWFEYDDDPFLKPKTSQQYKKAVTSYAFDLNWSAYTSSFVSVNNEELISYVNCEDRFYDFDYNKVYTVSGLIDNFKTANGANRFLSIKRVDDDSCENVINKFPTNDGVFYRTLFYIVTKFLLNSILSLFLIIIPIYNVVATLVNIIYKAIIITLCSICNSKLFNDSNFCENLDCSNTSKPLMGPLKMPMITYPNCETCSCDDGSTVETEENPNNILLKGVLVPFGISSAYTLLDDPTYYNTFVNNKSLITYDNRDYLKQLIGGRWSNSGNNIQGTTGLIGNYITNDLPFGERINQFNAKSSYFSGKNIIKLAYEPESNYDPVNDVYKHHFDNTLSMICLPGVSLNAGDMFTMVNPKNSPDKNISGQPTPNNIGLFSTTGTTTIPDNIGIIYANNTDTLSNNNVTYFTPELANNNSGKILYYTYPSDVEYYQVIASYTVSEFRQLISPSNIVVNSFADIIESTTTIDKLINCNCYETVTIDVTTGGDLTINLCNGALINANYTTGTHILSFDVCISTLAIPGGSSIVFNTLSYGDCCSSDSLTVKPIDSIDQNSLIIICQRGVDPYSPKIKTKVSLGRIFGYEDFDQVIVEDSYRINIPIRNTISGFGLEPMASHMILNNSQTNNGFNLFFESNFFSPGNNYISYLTLNNMFYSRLDYELATSIPPYSININSNTQLDNTKIDSSVSDIKKIKANITNSYLSQNQESESYSVDETFAGSSYMYFDKLSNPPVLSCYENVSIFIGPSTSGGVVYYENCDGTINSFSVGPNGGTYQIAECINISTITTYDDISFGSISYGNSCQNNSSSLYRTYYFSTIYGSNSTLTMSDSSKIVMRSDRLPSSDVLTYNDNNTYLLQQNPTAVIYKLTNNNLTVINPSYGSDSYSDDLEPDDNFYENNVLSTFSCENMVDLNCYEQKDDTIVVKPNCADEDRVEGGCYVFCKSCRDTSKIFGPLKDIPGDFKAALNYKKRFVYFYSICQNIISQTFTNNWINGTLYAYPFKINTFYDDKNKVSNRVYCKDVVLLHPKSNNFYYRSSPWDDVSKVFIGQKSRGDSSNGSNITNLKYPTTILNMGPRSSFLDKLILNGKYGGYIMNTIRETSYNDNSDIVNLFVYSRLLSNNFLSLFGQFTGNIITSTISDPVKKFFSRPGDKIDADLAQSIAVNTQYGIIPVDNTSYTSGLGPQLSSIYINLPKNKDPMLGVMFSATTEDIQNRDYISPGRIIRYDIVNSQFLYDNLGINSQLTPHYKWKVNTGEPVATLGNTPFMFGNETNDWISGPSDIIKIKYQEMDRLSSGYPLYNTIVNNYNATGYLYGNNSNTIATTNYNYSANILPADKQILVGAPWYFYFGLNRGKTAINKFYTKYIGGNNIDGE